MSGQSPSGMLYQESQHKFNLNLKKNNLILQLLTHFCQYLVHLFKTLRQNSEGFVRNSSPHGGGKFVMTCSSLTQ